MSWDWQIDDKYKIASNDRQYLLQMAYQSTDKETGEKIKKWKNVASSDKLSGVASVLFERGVRSEDVRNAAEAQKAAQKWLQTISNALQPNLQVVKVI